MRYPVSFYEILPIRRISFTTPERDRARLLEEGKGYYAAYLSTGDPSKLLAFTAAQLAVQPERADVVHDLLAFLAECMIDMNKVKQNEIRGFLEWLERNTGGKVDDWSNKTQIRAFHESDINTLLSILQKNSKKLRINPSSRTFQENLDLEYRRSMVILGQVKPQIAATDELIDQIVYKLYGLTEEEIKIVEGA